MAIFQCTIAKHYSTHIMVNGQSMLITFEGGFDKPYKHNGTYVTDDPEIIKAIESDSEFNREIIRIDKKVDVEPVAPKPVIEPVKVEPVIEDPVIPVGDIPEAQNADKDEPQVTSVPDITNFQQARAYMRATYPDIPVSQLSSKEEVITVAANRGIVFPDWIIK